MKREQRECDAQESMRQLVAAVSHGTPAISDRRDVDRSILAAAALVSLGAELSTVQRLLFPADTARRVFDAPYVVLRLIEMQWRLK